MQHPSTRFQIATACALFILLGAALIPYAGVQNDEALFTLPLYQLNPGEFSISIFHVHVPLMIMSYVGTLKTLIYAPILAWFGPNVWTVRLPMVLAGALTIFAFYRLTLRSAGFTAALLAAFLLATDPSFLLTDTFDWGPVALEHLLLVTGCLFLVHFAQPSVSFRVSMWNLALGFFFFGLALWDKAIFLWALAGVVCGGALVFWPEVRKALRPRLIATAAAAFLFGALPFVVYNIRHLNATVDANAHLEARAGIAPKFHMMGATLDGSALFGFIPESYWGDHPRPAQSRRGRLAEWIGDRSGQHRRGGMEIALIVALLAVPWWWRSRAARFSLVFMMVATAAMFLTRGAGTAVHHSVLLWPFPQFFVAIVLSLLPWRAILPAAGAVLVALNLLVVNQYISDFERDGAAGNFTDALFPLSSALPSGRPIYVMDWGMINTLALLHQGRLPLNEAHGFIRQRRANQIQRQIIQRMLADSSAIFLDHVPSREVFSGIRVRLDRAAAANGYQEAPVQTIFDSNGRPVFEMFRFRKIG